VGCGNLRVVHLSGFQGPGVFRQRRSHICQGAGTSAAPEKFGVRRLELETGTWILGVTGIFCGTPRRFGFLNLGLTRNERHMVLNLMAGLQAGGRRVALCTVNNALDEKYMEALGYPAPRTNFRIGLNAGF